MIRKTSWRAAAQLALCVTVLAAACAPQDDVLSWKLGLAPPRTLTVPSALQAELAANDFVGAAGRVRADVPAQQVELTLTGLPTSGSATYRLNLLLGNARIHPQSTASRVLGWLYPTAHAHELTEEPLRIPMADFVVDTGGRASLKLEAVQVNLAFAAGAEIELIAAGEQSGEIVLEGVIGNLDEEGDVVEDVDTGGGHTH